MNEQLVEKLEIIRDNTLKDVAILGTTFYWDQRIDLRIRSFTKLIFAQMGLMAGFMYPTLELDNEEMISRLNSRFIANRDEVTRSSLLIPFVLLLKQGFVTTLTFLVESTLRVYSIVLDHEWHITSQGRFSPRSFIDIGNHLFDEVLDFQSTELIDPFPTLDILRNIRNSLHNNSVHYSPVFDPQLSPINILYRGKTYSFTPGETIKFVKWELLLDICDDIRALLFHLSKHQKISSIQAVILDPSVDRKTKLSELRSD